MAIVPAQRVVELLGPWRRDGVSRERLAGAVRALVLDGRLAVESRLPAERGLAAALSVSRATVTSAYDQLREEGYVESRQGAGSWVTLPGGNRAAPSDAIVSGSGLDLRIAALPAPAVLEELFAGAVRELPRWLDHHGYDPLGLPPLRRAIAARFEQRGLPTRPEQILVTNGALHALDLAIRATFPRGRRVLVELPSYPAALDALRGVGGRLTPVPLRRDGWDVDAIEAITRDEAVALAYLMPDFHNPTGLDHGHGHPPALAACARGRGRDHRPRRDIRGAEPGRGTDPGAGRRLRRRAHDHDRLAQQGGVGRLAAWDGPAPIRR